MDFDVKIELVDLDNGYIRVVGTADIPSTPQKPREEVARQVEVTGRTTRQVEQGVAKVKRKLNADCVSYVRKQNLFTELKHTFDSAYRLSVDGGTYS